MNSARISIEVVYAPRLRQIVRRLSLPAGSSVADALRASGLLGEFPEIESARVGIYGEVVRPDTRLRDRDRVEIYRPLQADPKEIRRTRARKNALR